MIVIRETVIGEAVLGSLYVGGCKVCDTLENKATLIPCGEYKLSVSKSPRFSRDLPLVYNDTVKPTRGIRIHVGNAYTNSSGCLLVGFGRNGSFLTNSKDAEAVVTSLARIDNVLHIAGNAVA